MQYIATFFTHFDGVTFAGDLHKQGLEATLSPVPRKLSSSCGTCVRFEFNGDPLTLVHDELEQLVQVDGDSYILLKNNN